MAKYNKICINCNKEFIGTSSTQKFCIECSTIELTCIICGNKYTIKRSRYERSKGQAHTCSRKCSTTYASRKAHENKIEKFCGICNMITKHHQNDQCMRCIALKNSEKWEDWVHSDKCNLIRRKNADKWIHSEKGHEFSKNNITNFNNSKQGKEHIKNNLNNIHNKMSNGQGANSIENIKKRHQIMKENKTSIYNPNHRGYKYCEICNTETIHIGNRCFNCNPWNIYITEKHFTEKDGIMYYKGQEWENYKQSFITKDINIRDFDKYNGFWQKTYLVNDVDLTGKDAIEQELLEKEISWFVYIKFYIDSEGYIKPLVCGKTGSKLVNKGTDINFSYNLLENSANAARIFLNEQNLKWYKKQIYIIPCDSEKDAYKLELEIRNNYNLFE